LSSKNFNKMWNNFFVNYTLDQVGDFSRVHHFIIVENELSLGIIEQYICLIPNMSYTIQLFSILRFHDAIGFDVIFQWSIHQVFSIPNWEQVLYSKNLLSMKWALDGTKQVSYSNDLLPI